MLTNQQQEILDILTEEAAEVIQCISKIRRFGVEQCHPDNPNYSNLDHLTEELGDLTCMIGLVTATGICDPWAINAANVKKKAKLIKYSTIFSGETE